MNDQHRRLFELAAHRDVRADHRWVLARHHVEAFHDAENERRRAERERLAAIPNFLPAFDPTKYIEWNAPLPPPVKIGFTTNITTRISTLNPEHVLAVERGGRDVEVLRHREFATARRHGEWFAATPDLREHIRVLRDRFEEVSGLTLDAWLDRPSQRRKPPTSSDSILDSSPSGREATDSNRSAASASADPS